jgi:Cytochrome c7 and related cytochrome c
MRSFYNKLFITISLSVSIAFAIFLLDSVLAESETQSASSSSKTDLEEQKYDSIPQESYPDYPAVGKDKGVWNDGQAALWDLKILDYYKYVGPKSRASGHKPTQPINFSHIVHVQKNKMECQYCHWSVNKAAYAALPDVESCMGCHNLVLGSDEKSQKEIAKIREAYQKGVPIEWAKVHVMPDYYKFNHKRHVKSGVTCHECHGQVGEMAVVERVSSMKMGWCLDCHRTKGASIDCATCHY